MTILMTLLYVDKDFDEFALDVLLMMMLLLMMMILLMMMMVIMMMMMMATRKLQLLFTERTAAGRTQQTISNVVQPE